jgi:hypothetical protein
MKMIKARCVRGKRTEDKFRAYPGLASGSAPAATHAQSATAQQRKKADNPNFPAPVTGAVTAILELPLDHHLFDLCDRFGRVQALGTSLRAIQDGVAAIEPERILEIVEPFAGCLIA